MGFLLHGLFRTSVEWFYRVYDVDMRSGKQEVQIVNPNDEANADQILTPTPPDDVIIGTRPIIFYIRRLGLRVRQRRSRRIHR